MSVTSASWSLGRIPFLCAVILLSAACARTVPEIQTLSSLQLDPDRQQLAIREVRELQSQGRRVWCVPFARNASGIDIRGNAETWWGKAKGIYARGHEPAVGAVMAFAKTSKNPMGHVAVVSEVVSDREIKVDHANWTRNKISLNMKVVDVSSAGDWSSVRLESQPNSLGRAYPINGFIYPQTTSAI